LPGTGAHSEHLPQVADFFFFFFFFFALPSSSLPRLRPAVDVVVVVVSLDVLVRVASFRLRRESGGVWPPVR